MPAALQRIELDHLRQWIENQQPAQAIVRLTPPTSGTTKWYVEYQAPINVVDGNSRRELTSEEHVRAAYITYLTTVLHYPPEKLFLELPKWSGSTGSATNPDAELDIAILGEDEALPTTPDQFSRVRWYAHIEIKPPETFNPEGTSIRNQLYSFHYAYPCDVLLYGSLRAVHSASTPPELRTVNIGTNSFPRFDDWVTAGKPGINSDHIPDFFGRTPKPLFAAEPITENQVPLQRVISKEELDRIASELHNSLWHGSTKDDVIFKNIVYLFLAKIEDELSTPPGHSYSFQRVVWTDEAGRETFQSDDDLFNRIDLLFRKAYGQRVVYPRRDPGNVQGLRREEFPPSKVGIVVEKIAGLSLTNAIGNSSGDLLGSFFEKIQRDTYKESEGKYFTHPNLTHFIVKGLKLGELAKELITHGPDDHPLPKVLDPCCGSGTFLIAAMHEVTKSLQSSRATLPRGAQNRVDEFITDNRPNAWARHYLYGIDTDEVLAVAAKVNMVLRQDGSSNIIAENAIRRIAELPAQFREGIFDVIISNPPFGATLPPEAQPLINETALPRAVAAKKTEALLLEQYERWLTYGGRLGVVLPEGIFTNHNWSGVRVWLLKHFRIQAIVGIPRLAFGLFVNQRTVLLFAQKRLEREYQAVDQAFRQAEAVYKGRVDRITHRLKRKLSLWEQEAVSVLETFGVDEIVGRGERRHKMVFSRLLDISQENEVPTRLLEADYFREEEEQVRELADEIYDCLVGAKNPIDRVYSGLKFLTDGLVQNLAMADVCCERNEDPLLIDVPHVGYKREKRNERERPNFLFAAYNSENQPVRNLASHQNEWWVDSSDRNTALGLMEDIQW